MPRSLRILDLVRSLNPVHGGPAEGVRQLVTATHALGHRHEVLTLDAPADPWLGAFPAPTHALGPVRANYGFTPALRPWLQAHAGDYDALIVHGLWQYQGLATWQALRHGGVPYFVFPHGMLDPWFKHRYPLKHAKKWLYWACAEQRVLRSAAAVLYTTGEEARLAVRTFWPYRARHEVLGYGIDLDAAARSAQADDFLAAFPVLRGRRLLLFLGRLHPKKGCDLLVEAFARVAQHDPRLHLVLAGPDPVGLRAVLERLALRLGVADRVTCTGMLAGTLKWGALRAAEVFVLPSHQENFGIAVAEALAMGLPVLISSQVNIWPEVVRSGAGLAEPDTLWGSLTLLERWLALPAPAQAQMRQRAQACFARYFHIGAVAHRLVELVGAHATPRASSLALQAVSQP